MLTMNLLVCVFIYILKLKDWVIEDLYLADRYSLNSTMVLRNRTKKIIASTLKFTFFLNNSFFSSIFLVLVVVLSAHSFSLWLSFVLLVHYIWIVNFWLMCQRWYCFLCKYFILFHTAMRRRPWLTLWMSCVCSPLFYATQHYMSVFTMRSENNM